MTPSRWSFFSLALILACGAPTPIETSLGGASRRKPDGVLLEPAPAIPEAVFHAEARGVVALKPPVTVLDARDVVRDFFDAFAHEDTRKLDVLFTPDVIDLFSHVGKVELYRDYQQRFSRKDYTKILGLEVAHLERAELREHDDLQATGAHARPAEMLPGDILLRVPVTAPLVNGERLFEDVLVLLLRRDSKGALKIAGVGETN